MGHSISGGATPEAACVDALSHSFQACFGGSDARHLVSLTFLFTLLALQLTISLFVCYCCYRSGGDRERGRYELTVAQLQAQLRVLPVRERDSDADLEDGDSGNLDPGRSLSRAWNSSHHQVRRRGIVA